MTFREEKGFFPGFDGDEEEPGLQHEQLAALLTDN